MYSTANGYKDYIPMAYYLARFDLMTKYAYYVAIFVNEIIALRSSTTHIQRMQKALSEMNLHLHQVLSDITGVTGIKIIQAIIAGERDPKVLATYRDRRVKSTQADIEAALTGDYRPEHVFILSQELSLYQTYQAQIEKCDARNSKMLSSL